MRASGSTQLPGGSSPTSAGRAGRVPRRGAGGRGGTTLRRIVESITGLTTVQLEDGSIRYAGKVEAGHIAKEPGVKGGQSIRALPFGYVAHGRAADPAALLDASLTVGADGVIRELAVSWPGWTYTVSYSGLGATPAPEAPENAKPLRPARP